MTCTLKIIKINCFLASKFPSKFYGETIHLYLNWYRTIGLLYVPMLLLYGYIKNMNGKQFEVKKER